MAVLLAVLKRDENAARLRLTALTTESVSIVKTEELRLRNRTSRNELSNYSSKINVGVDQ